MDSPATIKVKPWATDDSQGDHVVINEADFDPSVHQRLDEVDDKPKRGRKSANAAAE